MSNAVRVVVPGATGAGYGGTSTTTVTIGAGSKTWTTQAGLAYVVGQRVRVAHSATKYAEGAVTAYSGTSISITVDNLSGDGESFSSWSIGVAGDIGAAGPQGEAAPAWPRVGLAATAQGTTIAITPVVTRPANASGSYTFTRATIGTESAITANDTNSKNVVLTHSGADGSVIGTRTIPLTFTGTNATGSIGAGAAVTIVLDTPIVQGPGERIKCSTTLIGVGQALPALEVTLS